MDETITKAWPWDELQIDASADERAVRRAYARLLKQRRPDDDVDAFQRLRAAYESALSLTQFAVAQAATTTMTQPETPAETDASATGVRKEAVLAAVAEAQENVSAPAVPAQRAPITLDEPESGPEVTAAELWQAFVDDPERIHSHRALTTLFAETVDLRVRDELEWQALCYCLRDDTRAMLRIHLSQLLGWRENRRHLMRRNPGIASQALTRAFVDEDYETLRAQFPEAIELLEGAAGGFGYAALTMLSKRRRTQMHHLLHTLRHYYPDVMRLRMMPARVEFWTRWQMQRARASQLVLPAFAQALWIGFLVASATTLHTNGLAWLGPWGPLQITLMFATTMFNLIATLVTTTSTPERRGALNRWRGKPLFKYGWAVIWLAAIAPALAAGPTGHAASAALVALAVCTMWASAVHGLLPIQALWILPGLAAVGLGFVGHCIDVDRPLWVLGLAHGLLLTYFTAFLHAPIAALIKRRPAVHYELAGIWLAAVAMFFALLFAQDWRMTQYAWGLYALMSVAAAGFVKAAAERRLGGSLQMRGIIVLVGLIVAIVKPEAIASAFVALLTLSVAGNLRRKKAAVS